MKSRIYRIILIALFLFFAVLILCREDYKADSVVMLMCFVGELYIGTKLDRLNKLLEKEQDDADETETD